ncbi:MAG: hypothetical protein EAX95_02900 [Candidatus Thorarchaeota archaeon]|nr:hypothetical protein [Candidatus Thorarchaeota archaeon]
MGRREGIDISKACPLTPALEKGLNTRIIRREIILTMSLTIILMTSGLVYYLMLPPPYTPPPLAPHTAIEIDGDANFSATALLEGWLGDGSPENPYIIESLDIDLEGAPGNCIYIENTRLYFIIRNCNLTGGSSGINLWNVTNGELVNNKCSNNTGCGICIAAYPSTVSNNTVVNNTCISNGESGISVYRSNLHTVSDNICSKNRIGIHLRAELAESMFNTISNNKCFNNTECGILIDAYHSTASNNTVVNNTCISNGESGISLSSSEFSTVVNNTCNYNKGCGIRVGEAVGMGTRKSSNNSITSNTCNCNNIGIYIDESDFNTVESNTCNNNSIGIFLYESENNIVTNNTFSGNTEYDILGEFVTTESVIEEDLTVEEFLGGELVLSIAGCGMLLVVSVIALVQFRRMRIH